MYEYKCVCVYKCETVCVSLFVEKVRNSFHAIFHPQHQVSRDLNHTNLNTISFSHIKQTQIHTHTHTNSNTRTHTHTHIHLKTLHALDYFVG